jgi:hypothetical protein
MTAFQDEFANELRTLRKSLKIENEEIIGDIQSRSLLNRLVREASECIGEKIEEYQVLLGLHACPEGAELTSKVWDYVRWAAHRSTRTPCPITTKDIQKVRMMAEPPEVEYVINFTSTGFEVMPAAVIPTVMPFVPKLQKMLDLPVEWDHVVFAMALAGQRGKSKITVDVLAEILREVHDKIGKLPELSIVQEGDATDG